MLYSEGCGTRLGASLLTEGYAGICVRGNAGARHQKTVIIATVVGRGENSVWPLGSGRGRSCSGLERMFQDREKKADLA